MSKRYLLVILLVVLLAVAACGGDESTPTPPPLPTFTPTAVPTATQAPTAIPTVAPTTAPAEEPTAIPATAPSGEQASAAVAPESPLAAPESPLAPPAPPPAAIEVTPVITPVTGYWQLETIRIMTTTQPVTTTDSIRLALSNTGAATVLADCRPGRGSYALDAAGSLRFDVAFTGARCAPSSLADGFANALALTHGYRFEGGKLMLVYGAQGGEMGMIPVIQSMPLGAALLGWPQLQNMTYYVESVPAGDGQAPLTNGEFRAKTAPDATTDYVVSLSNIHSYVDLDSDGTIDTLTILVVDDGNSGTSYHLVPVLNGGGLPIPLQPERLGDRVFVRDLRVEGNQIVVDLDTPGDAACCPTNSLRRTYAFEGNGLTLISEEALEAPQMHASLDVVPQTIVLEAGATNAVLTGTVPFNGIQPYRITAQAGQQLSATVQTPFNDVWLSIYGETDGTVLRSIRSEKTDWAGAVPFTQDYIINAVAAGSTTPYTLTIDRIGELSGTVTPDLPAVSTDKVVYLTFDASPTLTSTATLLDILARNNAKGDFFVSGAQAAAYPELLASVANAGHSLGSYATNPLPLSNFGRDLFIQETEQTRSILGDQGTQCLRPAYDATDAYSRAYAAELGYDLLLWDVNSNDWAEPDVEKIVETVQSSVFPGAVVLLHDSPGGSGQTGAALETLLPALAQQGYVFRPYCQIAPK